MADCALCVCALKALRGPETRPLKTEKVWVLAYPIGGVAMDYLIVMFVT